MQNVIEVNNLYKKFENFVLGEISFSIPKGYITGFIGRNGAGKTSTIKSLLSLVHHEGTINLNGEKLQNLDYLQHVGIVMDEPFLAKDWPMTLVNEAMECGYDQWDEREFFTYLDRFGIATSAKVHELSRGMKIKLMLAIALAHRAKLLILDEPTSGLDPSMRDELTDLLKDFVQDEDHSVLFSTHITQDLDRIADYIIFIDNGKLVDSCPKDTFLEKYIVVKGGMNEFASLENHFTILGKRVSSVSFEALVKASDSTSIPDEFIVEKPDIERIMVLYGRK